MAFDKNEIKQLKQIVIGSIVEKVPEIVQPMLDKQKKEILLDVRILIQQELRPIKVDIKWIKERLLKIEKMESEDIKASYEDIESLKEKIKTLENRVGQLEALKS